MIGILRKSKHYFRECIRERDSGPLYNKNSNDTDYQKLHAKHKDTGLETWDARHLACVINYLRWYGGISRPRIITADKKFMKIIEKEGYEVINPEKTTIQQFCTIIS